MTTVEDMSMQIELYYLVLSTAFTAVLWVPYVLDRFLVRGIAGTVGYPESPKPASPWAERLKAAHGNAVENLVVFAALVLVANAMDLANAATAFAAMLYFWSRVVHALAYTFKVPWVRTLAFLGGFAAQMIFVVQFLAK
ncbi:MAG TPA: MAPEG family protein [Usitatibacter sp.]|nr:MAPEG family protein [Usitatibacter sp.]